MKLTVERDRMIAALAPAWRLAKVKHTIPILSHVLLSATDSELTIIGNDCYACVEAMCPAEVEVAGRITVPGDNLQKLLQRSPEGCQIVLELVDGELAVRFGRSRYKLPTLPAEDFPAMMVADNATKMDLTAEQIDAMFKRCKPFTAPNDIARPWLGGIHLRTAKGGLVAEASDGGFLMQRVVKIKLQGFAGAIIPCSAVDSILELAKDGCVLRISKTLMAIDVEGISFTSKMIDGTFPDLERVVPKGGKGCLRCDREDLIAAVERLMTLDDDKRALVFRWEKDAGLFTVSLRGSGEGAEEVEAEVDQLDAGEFGVSPRLLRIMLQETPGEMVELHYIDPGTPLRIAHKLTPDLVAVVMPRKV
jgi:DNA polymerase-3 subunit beta